MTLSKLANLDLPFFFSFEDGDNDINYPIMLLQKKKKLRKMESTYNSAQHKVSIQEMLDIIAVIADLN